MEQNIENHQVNDENENQVTPRRTDYQVNGEHFFKNDCFQIKSEPQTCVEDKYFGNGNQLKQPENSKDIINNKIGSQNSLAVPSKSGGTKFIIKINPNMKNETFMKLGLNMSPNQNSNYNSNQQSPYSQGEIIQRENNKEKTNNILPYSKIIDEESPKSNNMSKNVNKNQKLQNNNDIEFNNIGIEKEDFVIVDDEKEEVKQTQQEGQTIKESQNKQQTTNDFQSNIQNYENTGNNSSSSIIQNNESKEKQNIENSNNDSTNNKSRQQSLKQNSNNTKFDTVSGYSQNASNVSQMYNPLNYQDMQQFNSNNSEGLKNPFSIYQSNCNLFSSNDFYQQQMIFYNNQFYQQQMLKSGLNYDDMVKQQDSVSGGMGPPSIYGSQYISNTQSQIIQQTQQQLQYQSFQQQQQYIQQLQLQNKIQQQQIQKLQQSTQMVNETRVSENQSKNSSKENKSNIDNFEDQFPSFKPQQNSINNKNSHGEVKQQQMQSENKNNNKNTKFQINCIENQVQSEENSTENSKLNEIFLQQQVQQKDNSQQQQKYNQQLQFKINLLKVNTMNNNNSNNHSSNGKNSEEDNSFENNTITDDSNRLQVPSMFYSQNMQQNRNIIQGERSQNQTTAMQDIDLSVINQCRQSHIKGDRGDTVTEMYNMLSGVDMDQLQQLALENEEDQDKNNSKDLNMQNIDKIIRQKYLQLNGKNNQVSALSSLENNKQQLIQFQLNQNQLGYSQNFLANSSQNYAKQDNNNSNQNFNMQKKEKEGENKQYQQQQQLSKMESIQEENTTTSIGQQSNRSIKNINITSTNNNYNTENKSSNSSSTNNNLNSEISNQNTKTRQQQGGVDIVHSEVQTYNQRLKICQDENTNYHSLQIGGIDQVYVEGVEYLIQNSKQQLQDNFTKSQLKQELYLLENATPLEISKLLLNTKGLNKKMLGKMFGDADSQYQSIFQAFVQNLQIQDLCIDEALRLVLKEFRLPCNASQINRIMTQFANIYHQENPSMFLNEDVPYILSYSCLMLNVDIHSGIIPIKNQMKKVQFVQNNKTCCSSVKSKVLEDIYDRITQKKLEFINNYFESLYARLHISFYQLQGLQGKKFISALKDSKDLVQGEEFMKFGRKGKPHPRFVSIAEEEDRLLWRDMKNKKETPRQMFFSEITDILLGSNSTEVMKKNKIQNQFDSLCFSIVAQDRTLDLQAKDSETRSKWVRYFKLRVLQLKETLLNQTQEHILYIKKLQQSYSELWRSQIFPNWDLKYWNFNENNPQNLNEYMNFTKQQKNKENSVWSNIFSKQKKSPKKGNSYSSGAVKLTSALIGKNDEARAQNELNEIIAHNKQYMLVFLWKQGMPNWVRRIVWPLKIKNSLNITSALYENLQKQIKLFFQEENNYKNDKQLMDSLQNMQSDVDDISENFYIFSSQNNKPQKKRALQNILEAFIFFRPDIPYAKNIGYLATMLIHIFEEYQAFQLFLNMITQYIFLNLFMGNITEFEWMFELFNKYFQKEMPTLYQHFETIELKSSMYLIYWAQTLFSGYFQEESISLRILDNYLLEGDLYIIKTTLGIIKYFELELKMSSLEEALKIIRQKPNEINQIILFKTIEDIIIPPSEIISFKSQKQKQQFSSLLERSLLSTEDF